MIKVYIAAEPWTLRKDETTQNYSMTRFSLMESNSIGYNKNKNMHKPTYFDIKLVV